MNTNDAWHENRRKKPTDCNRIIWLFSTPSCTCSICHSSKIKIDQRRKKPLQLKALARNITQKPSTQSDSMLSLNSKGYFHRTNWIRKKKIIKTIALSTKMFHSFPFIYRKYSINELVAIVFSPFVFFFFEYSITIYRCGRGKWHHPFLDIHSFDGKTEFRLTTCNRFFICTTWYTIHLIQHARHMTSIRQIHYSRFSSWCEWLNDSK